MMQQVQKPMMAIEWMIYDDNSQQCIQADNDLMKPFVAIVNVLKD